PDVRPFQALEFPLGNICGWDIPEDDDVPSLLAAVPDEGNPSLLFIPRKWLHQRGTTFQLLPEFLQGLLVSLSQFLSKTANARAFVPPRLRFGLLRNRELGRHPDEAAHHRPA